jgi:nucleotide-binding universal stress UspA family protein
MTTTLVLGYDGSECANLALDRTAELVKDLPGATVLVVYAFEFSIAYVPTGMADSPLMMSAEYDNHVQLVRDYGERQVAAAAARLSAVGVKAETVVEEGKPVDVLLQLAGERDAAAIVVGSHGEGAVSAAFLGSTALKLLHHSTVPVLVVPRHKKD